MSDTRHPEVNIGSVVAVYVWTYPLRLVRWGLVISIGVLGFTGGGLGFIKRAIPKPSVAD